MKGLPHASLQTKGRLDLFFIWGSVGGGGGLFGVEVGGEVYAWA